MNNSLINMLYMILGIMVFVVIFLSILFVIIKIKENNAEKDTKKESEESNIVKKESDVSKNTNKVVKEYQTKSIFDFMEFENIKDNMIIQKKGKRYLMVIECQGVNYDLMSDVEKTSTEQGFATFLNTLKDPIQIYIQTRTVNLESNIQKYKKRLAKIKERLDFKVYKLNQYLENDNPNENVIKNQKFDVLRETNLYEYGKDVIADTERMSLNKNVLKKKYYIVIRYYYEPTDAEGEGLLAKEEIEEIAFSNLYTRASSIIRVLSGIGISGSTLNSFELVDLMYNAYNRDDSEVFGIEKAIDAGFNEIYVDSQSVIEKRIEALNKEIKARAEKTILDAAQKLEDDKSKELQEIEENIEDIIIELAKKMLEDADVNMSEEDRKKIIANIEEKNNTKGEKNSNGKKETKESNRKRKSN